MDTLTTSFEQLLTDRRVQLAGAVVGAIVLAISIGLIVASRSPTQFKAASTHLPQHTLEIPIMRSLPEPLPKANGRASRPGPGRTETARR
jgi:hypothetical protein